MNSFENQMVPTFTKIDSSVIIFRNLMLTICLGKDYPQGFCFHFKNKVTLWRRVLNKLIVAQLLKKFPSLYGIQ